MISWQKIIEIFGIFPNDHLQINGLLLGIICNDFEIRAVHSNATRINHPLTQYNSVRKLQHLPTKLNGLKYKELVFYKRKKKQFIFPIYSMILKLAGLLLGSAEFKLLTLLFILNLHFLLQKKI